MWYHFREPTKMVADGHKKAQFRIEHLTGALRYGLTIMRFGTANMGRIFEINKKNHPIFAAHLK